MQHIYQMNHSIWSQYINNTTYLFEIREIPFANPVWFVWNSQERLYISNLMTNSNAGTPWLLSFIIKSRIHRNTEKPFFFRRKKSKSKNATICCTVNLWEWSKLFFFACWTPQWTWAIYAAKCMMEPINQAIDVKLADNSGGHALLATPRATYKPRIMTYCGADSHMMVFHGVSLWMQ